MALALKPKVAGFDTVTVNRDGEEIELAVLIVSTITLGARGALRTSRILFGEGVSVSDLREALPAGTVLNDHKVVKMPVDDPYTFTGDDGKQVTLNYRYELLDTQDEVAVAGYHRKIAGVKSGDVELSIQRGKPSEAKPVAPSSDISATDEEVEEQDTIDPITGEITDDAPLEEASTAKAKK